MSGDRKDTIRLTGSKDAIRLPKVIYRPDLQHRWHKWFYVVVSILAWLFWLYLFAPMVQSSLRVFGWFRRIDPYQVTKATDRVGVLEIYAIIVVGAGAVLLLWAIYNLLRFRGRNRRLSSRPVTVAETARYFQLREDQVQTLHSAQVVRVHHDESGAITFVDYLQPATLAPLVGLTAGGSDADTPVQCHREPCNESMEKLATPVPEALCRCPEGVPQETGSDALIDTPKTGSDALTDRP